MSGFIGMDTAQAEGFGALLERQSRTVEDICEAVGSRVHVIVGTGWVGPDADEFGARTDREVWARLNELRDLLRTLGEELISHIEEQNRASDVEDAWGAFLDGVGEFFAGVGEFFAGVGEFLGEVWENFIENLIPNWGSITGLGLTAGGDVFGQILKSGGRLLGSAVPYVGDVFTGVLAGIERWNEDSEYGLGERLGRALLDGGVNFGGSLLGGMAGTAVGGAIGGALGGGGGAAAGAPAAGIGAIFGAIGGGSVGAGVGMVVGDAVGSYLGGAAADAVIDAILD